MREVTTHAFTAMSCLLEVLAKLCLEQIVHFGCLLRIIDRNLVLDPFRNEWLSLILKGVHSISALTVWWESLEPVESGLQRICLFVWVLKECQTCLLRKFWWPNSEKILSLVSHTKIQMVVRLASNNCAKHRLSNFYVFRPKKSNLLPLMVCKFNFIVRERSDIFLLQLTK